MSEEKKRKLSEDDVLACFDVCRREGGGNVINIAANLHVFTALKKKFSDPADIVAFSEYCEIAKGSPTPILRPDYITAYDGAKRAAGGAKQLLGYIKYCELQGIPALIEKAAIGRYRDFISGISL